jgi:hypothetical protein
MSHRILAYTEGPEVGASSARSEVLVSGMCNSSLHSPPGPPAALRVAPAPELDGLVAKTQPQAVLSEPWV